MSTYRLEAPVGEFNLTRLERVIYGPGKVAELKEEMAKRGLKRAVVVTTSAAFPILDQGDRRSRPTLRIGIHRRDPASCHAAPSTHCKRKSSGSKPIR